jgi:hypothetical protein
MPMQMKTRDKCYSAFLYAVNSFYSKNEILSEIGTKYLLAAGHKFDSH